MLTRRSALRVAIVGTNDPRNVSGGRYHALMLAYAVAASEGEAHLVTDHVPGFMGELDQLAPGRVQVWQTQDFANGLPEGGFDWIVVVPTGIFLPEFYESCLDFVARAGARLALVNFESANWFNAMAPEPRDPRLWDYWRRICVHGALVLCSARVSYDWARKFYMAPEGDLRFEIWSPPINSPVAQRFDGLQKDGSVVAFIRPQDLHKGSNLLLKLDPALFAGRTLRLVSGRDVPRDFRTAMEAHLRGSPGASLDISLRISDLHKFRLLTSAQAVLFPSRFEGFGYPPVEAAYAGTECVCFDLPVLRETVGKVAHFAPTMDVEGFQSAISAALDTSERRGALRDSVYELVDFGRAALRLSEVLTRSADRVRPLPPRSFRAMIGPLAKAPPISANKVDRSANLGTFPPYLVNVVTTSAEEVLITGRVLLSPSVDEMTATTSGGTCLPVTMIGRPDQTGQIDMRFFVLAPKDVLGRRINVQPLSSGTPDPAVIELIVERAAAANPLCPAVSGISSNAETDSGRRLRGWVLAREPITTVCLAPHGTNWFRIEVTGERRDLIAKYPTYAAARCEFTAELPITAEPDRQEALMFCLSGALGQERAIDALVGWTPAPKPYFRGAVKYADIISKAPAAKPEEAVERWTPGRSKPRRAQLGSLQILDRSDSVWRRGVARAGAPGRLGVILVSKADDLKHVVTGAALAFEDGSARAVVSVKVKDESAEIVLDGPIDQYATISSTKVAVFAVGTIEDAIQTFIIKDWTDDRWWRGVWNRQDHRFRRGFNAKTDVAESLGLATGARLRFACSGFRRVVSHEDDKFNNRRLWLDSEIRPLADGEPNSVEIVAPASRKAGGISFSLARANAGWPGGIMADASGQLAAGRAVLLDARAESVVSPGVVLHFFGGTLRRVLSTSLQEDGLVAIIDGRVDFLLHGDPAPVAVLNEIDIPMGLPPPYRFPNPDLPAKDPFFLHMVRHAWRRGDALLTVKPAACSLRVLVLSAVSPSPANQGNRVVTRNLIRHLVECGFGCDVVVQNWVDCAAATAEFGDTVRFVAVPFPSWQQSPSAASRKVIQGAAELLQRSRIDAELGSAIRESAEEFHPYFIVRDDTVDIARVLYAATDYAAIICNYTHLIRVAEELRDIRPLPPVAVFTHDALSRLPAMVHGRRLDRAFRACPPLLEQQTLDAVPGAVIVAISRSEADYFAEIGVTNPILVAEYDAAYEMTPYRINEDAFSRRIIIFHGSSNPMNIAGMDWFVDECWATILTAVPDAKLVVCGNIGAKWSPTIPGIEITGELSRDEMLGRCSQASMTINPCVAGTGLKIKTVEAACLGLPAVCLPTAVDGLDEVANRFAIVVQDGPSFAASCVALLTDQEKWIGLRRGALEIAESRFSSASVYGALDSAMGWMRKTNSPDWSAETFTGAKLSRFPDASRSVQHGRNDEATLFNLAQQLIRAGQSQVGWNMIAETAYKRRRDPEIARWAASAALDAGEYWAAAVYAAIVIANRPDLAQGYLTFGRAMLGCNLPHEAESALLQALLLSSGSTRSLPYLIEALRRTGKNDAVKVWSRRRSVLPTFGEYIPAEAFCSPDAMHGFDITADRTLALAARKGSIRIDLPELEVERFDLVIDLRLPEKVTEEVVLSFRVLSRQQRLCVPARGGRAHTVTFNADASCVDENGRIILTIELLSAPSAWLTVEIIGLLLKDPISAGRV